MAREYLTHWFVAGVIVTGFTPDHWVANVFHAVKLDSLRGAFIEYQFLAIYIGATFLILDVVVRNRKRQTETPAAAAPVIETAAPIPAMVNDDAEDIEGKPSIAVLPFVNMSDDKSQEYFADGMTEDIITGLSCDSRLFVAARNSTFAYRGLSPDIRTVGKELGVRYVLEGSIRPLNERLRITVQLVETATGAHIWADKIDRPTAEIFDVMDEVVDSLVTTLCANLGVAEANRAGRQRPEDLQAWALCVQAEVLFFSQFDPKTLLEAEKLARRATEIEPGYAASWALLACIASLQIVYMPSGNVVKDSEQALSLVNKALRLAPNDPVVLGYCGAAAAWAGQAAQGIDYLERSLALNPNSGFSRLGYGSAFVFSARYTEAVAQLQLFIRRSPKDPYLGLTYSQLAFSYLGLVDPEQAEQAARNSIKYAPGMPGAYLVLALTLRALRRDAEAQAEIQKIHQLEPGMTRQQWEDYWQYTTPAELSAGMIKLLRKTWRD